MAVFVQNTLGIFLSARADRKAAQDAGNEKIQIGRVFSAVVQAFSLFQVPPLRQPRIGLDRALRLDPEIVQQLKNLIHMNSPFLLNFLSVCALILLQKTSHVINK